jgi:predicted ATPase
MILQKVGRRGIDFNLVGPRALLSKIAQAPAGSPLKITGMYQQMRQRLARLDAESRRVLEVASVAGLEFTAAAIAVEGQRDALQTEAVCVELARRQRFVEARGNCEWPDGTVTTRYGFLHALYQEVLYERLAAGRRRFLHQQIAECQEHGYGRQAPEIAAELAVHFEHGREYGRAMQYRQHAADVAMQRYAYREAIVHLIQGKELLQRFPETPDRNHKELYLLLQLIEPLVTLKGEAAPEVEHICPYLGALPAGGQACDTLPGAVRDRDPQPCSWADSDCA